MSKGKFKVQLQSELNKPKLIALWLLGAVDITVEVIRKRILTKSIKVVILDEQGTKTSEPSV